MQSKSKLMNTKNNNFVVNNQNFIVGFCNSSRNGLIVENLITKEVELIKVFEKNERKIGLISFNKEFSKLIVFSKKMDILVFDIKVIDQKLSISKHNKYTFKPNKYNCIASIDNIYVILGKNRIILFDIVNYQNFKCLNTRFKEIKTLKFCKIPSKKIPNVCVVFLLLNGITQNTNCSKSEIFNLSKCFNEWKYISFNTITINDKNLKKKAITNLKEKIKNKSIRSIVLNKKCNNNHNKSKTKQNIEINFEKKQIRLEEKNKMLSNQIVLKEKEIEELKSDTQNLILRIKKLEKKLEEDTELYRKEIVKHLISKKKQSHILKIYETELQTLNSERQIRKFSLDNYNPPDQNIKEIKTRAVQNINKAIFQEINQMKQEIQKLRTENADLYSKINNLEQESCFCMSRISKETMSLNSFCTIW